jgi:hypothetical protein
MTRAVAHAQRNREIEKLLFIALIGCIVLSSLLYVLFVVRASVFASDHTRLSSEINSLRSQVGELESSYIAKNKNINQEYASSLGFKSTDKVVFATPAVLVSNAQGTGNEI